MEMWLLKSEKGGQTCGHLHVAEAEAWRCRDMQAEPSAWSVASARLAVKDDRRQRDVVHEIALWAWVGLASVAAVLGATALVVALVREDWEAAFVFAVGVWFCAAFSYAGVEWLRKEIGRPRILGGAVRHSDA